MLVRPTVYFVYRKSQLHRGSTIMRSIQLCNIGSRYLSNSYNFKSLQMPGGKFPWMQRAWVKSRDKLGIYIFSKTCIDVLSEKNRITLQNNSLGVCLDHVDRDFKKMPVEGVDIHLCSSFAQKKYIEESVFKPGINAGKVMVLLHNADERLSDFRSIERKELNSVYCGTPQVSFLTEAILERIDVLDASSYDLFSEALEKLPNYNLHYGVRFPEKPGRRVVKPFTKGFTAAFCDSNILVDKMTPDAVEFLGTDYPYLVDGLNEEEVLDAFSRAKDDFGGIEWQRGLEVMRDVKERVSPFALAGQLSKILKELGV